MLANSDELNTIESFEAVVYGSAPNRGMTLCAHPTRLSEVKHVKIRSFEMLPGFIIRPPLPQNRQQEM